MKPKVCPNCKQVIKGDESMQVTPRPGDIGYQYRHKRCPAPAPPPPAPAPTKPEPPKPAPAPKKPEPPQRSRK